ncbi:hypothetical protein Patl1_05849 [Pistacia atlantica]|uniref:Uncharacterized protein n=1 Tax=Pistacia atlantica TaxID=434234 RepID=A0ACC1BPZ1_9ROSI|nr:hypothetical protein Patl1_05849 [Pistacia atlantica]
MARTLSRSIFLNSPVNRSSISLLNRSNPNLTFPKYPSNLSKISNFPLAHSSMDAPPEGYRRNVGICLINSSKKIFAASRLDIPDSWQMPQGSANSTAAKDRIKRWCIDAECYYLLLGFPVTLLKFGDVFDVGGIDEGEDPKVAAIRELREETGISSAEVLAETPHWLTYDFPPDVREKLKHQWGSDWKGQAQKW